MAATSTITRAELFEEKRQNFKGWLELREVSVPSALVTQRYETVCWWVNRNRDALATHDWNVVGEVFGVDVEDAKKIQSGPEPDKFWRYVDFFMDICA